MFHRSANLFLRPAWAEDAGSIHAAISDPAIVRNLARAPWPYTRADAEAFVGLPAEPFLPCFLMTLPNAEPAQIVGGAGLGRDEDGQVQLGYWVARPFWGRGFATEAARALVGLAAALGHHRLVGWHFLDNPASGRVLAKAGLLPTGQVRPLGCRARGERVMAAEFALTLAEEGPLRTEMRAA